MPAPKYRTVYTVCIPYLYFFVYIYLKSTSFHLCFKHGLFHDSGCVAGALAISDQISLNSTYILAR